MSSGPFMIYIVIFFPTKTILTELKNVRTAYAKTERFTPALLF